MITVFATPEDIAEYIFNKLDSIDEVSSKKKTISINKQINFIFYNHQVVVTFYSAQAIEGDPKKFGRYLTTNIHFSLYERYNSTEQHGRFGDFVTNSQQKKHFPIYSNEIDAYFDLSLFQIKTAILQRIIET